MYINSVANSVVLQVYSRHEFYNMSFKIAHKLRSASGSAPLCRIVGVDVTVVPVKLHNEIWPSETDGDHNRHSCLYTDGQYVQRWQEAVTKGIFVYVLLGISPASV